MNNFWHYTMVPLMKTVLTIVLLLVVAALGIAFVVYIWSLLIAVL
jgi:hypothetical protein